MARGNPREINVVRVLEGTNVPSLAMNKLTTFLNKEPECYVFECIVCGGTREDPSIVDPGILHLPRTCAQADATCGEGTEDLRPSRAEFLPGSLVLAEYGTSRWPAIVEYSTDEFCDYCLEDDEEDVPHAYYVTFIAVDPHRTFGGWFSAQRLKPLQKYVVHHGNTRDPWLRSALNLSMAYLCAGLQPRLLALSRIAAELRLSDFMIDNSPTSMPVTANENTY